MLGKALVSVSLILSGGIAVAQEVASPAYRAGESWTYREINGYNNLQRATIVREVVSADGALRIVTRTGDGKLIDEAAFDAAGSLRSGALNDRARGPLEPALSMTPYPLAEGKRWKQIVTRSDATWGEKRDVRIYGRVLGWETVRVPAGEFKAIKIERDMYLGDQDSFRNQTERHEIEWYAPEVRMAVKVVVRERYLDHPHAVIGPRLEYDWFIRELVSNRPGS